MICCVLGCQKRCHFCPSLKRKLKTCAYHNALYKQRNRISRLRKQQLQERKNNELRKLRTEIAKLKRKNKSKK